MKILALVAIVIGAAALFGTRRETPFMRWGIIVLLAGVLVMSTGAMFTARGVTYGLVLAVCGAGVYYYGRLVRRERLFVAKPK